MLSQEELIATLVEVLPFVSSKTLERFDKDLS